MAYIRFWHGTLLTQEDVTELYNSASSTNLVSYNTNLITYNSSYSEPEPEIEPEPEEEPETNFETYSNPIVMATGHSCIWCMSEEDMKNMLENNTTPGAFASNTNLLVANLSSVINPNLNIVNITIGSTTGTTQALMERCVSETRAILHEMIIGENAYCPYNVTFNSGTFSSPYILGSAGGGVITVNSSWFYSSQSSYFTLSGYSVDGCVMILLHEILHILGIGSSTTWNNYLTYFSNTTGNHSSGIAGYSGPNALARYKELLRENGFSTSQIQYLPVENSYGAEPHMRIRKKEQN